HGGRLLAPGGAARRGRQSDGDVLRERADDARVRAALARSSSRHFRRAGSRHSGRRGQEVRDGAPGGAQEVAHRRLPRRGTCIHERDRPGLRQGDRGQGVDQGHEIPHRGPPAGAEGARPRETSSVRRPVGELIVPSRPSKELETFPNPRPGRDYEIAFEVPEFTCLCPKTGQPDFATLRIRYVPDALCVELKSLKLYIWSFRDEGHFHEDVTNRILDDLVAL